VLLPAAASAASPAAFTTDSTGSAVNKNHYDNKCDVYLNGGPTGASLADGSYTFVVLAPGGQADPNGPNKLSSDSNAQRTFSSSGGAISYSGSHATSTDAATGRTLIGLCDYDDTPNPGGVYILAICSTSNMTPSGCKYDAFKVGSNLPGVGNDLTATKTAAGAFVRTFSWDLVKGVDKTSVNTNSNTATFNYTVTVTKSAGVDSGFVVSGQVQVFNTNDRDVTGVSVSDAIGSTTCTVSGGATTIAFGSSATFDYTCSLPNTTTAATTGTNTATVTWDKTSINSPNDSATATAAFDFSAAPQLVNDCTTVTDTITPGTLGQVTLGSPCATTTYNYSRTDVPATGCLTYTNTAVESATEDSDSKSVTVCRTNSNGFTIGYWQNKNGQNQIKAVAGASLCTYLATFSNVLTGLPASCTSSKLATYVYEVVKLANAAGTGAPMFKAQFLATALNVYFAPALGTTGVVVPTTIDGDGCATVNELLAYGNTNYAALSTGDKTFFMTVKSLYDAINNNQAVTC